MGEQSLVDDGVRFHLSLLGLLQVLLNRLAWKLAFPVRISWWAVGWTLWALRGRLLSNISSSHLFLSAGLVRLGSSSRAFRMLVLA